LFCNQDYNGDVRQSAFALVGDIAKFCPAHLRPAIPHYVPLLLRSVLPENTAASNNACWALGEITFSSGQQVAPFVPELVDALLAIITSPRMAASLLENCAITLGRLALVNPEVVAQQLPRMAQNWCAALTSVRAHQEKEAAFHGLCAVVRVNPNGMVGTLNAFLRAIGSWQNAPPELHQNFCAIIHGYKNFVSPDDWASLIHSLEAETQITLQQYGV
jgi:transportin-1